MAAAKRKRVVTRLNSREMRDFRSARKYVRSFCGKVSDAEVLRFLVRDWVDLMRS